jgi:hypothetical protein
VYACSRVKGGSASDTRFAIEILKASRTDREGSVPGTVGRGGRDEKEAIRRCQQLGGVFFRRSTRRGRAVRVKESRKATIGDYYLSIIQTFFFSRHTRSSQKKDGDEL